jgi:hypothetical protein
MNRISFPLYHFLENTVFKAPLFLPVLMTYLNPLQSAGWLQMSGKRMAQA